MCKIYGKNTFDPLSKIPNSNTVFSPFETKGETNSTKQSRPSLQGGNSINLVKNKNERTLHNDGCFRNTKCRKASFALIFTN